MSRFRYKLFNVLTLSRRIDIGKYLSHIFIRATYMRSPASHKGHTPSPSIWKPRTLTHRCLVSIEIPPSPSDFLSFSFRHPELGGAFSENCEE